MKEKKYTLVTLSLFKNEVDILNRLSEVTGESKSFIVRQALRDINDKHNKESLKKAKQLLN